MNVKKKKEIVLTDEETVLSRATPKQTNKQKKTNKRVQQLFKSSKLEVVIEDNNEALGIFQESLSG